MINFPSWKIWLISIICALGVLLAIPNFLPSQTKANLPKWWQPVSLGLDLQGGSHLLMEVMVDDVAKDKLVSFEDSVRQALREERIKYDELGVDAKMLKVKILDRDKQSQALGVIKRLDTELEINTDGEYITASFSEQAFLSLQATAVERSIEIVRNRIDQLGTKEPSIQKQGENRILIQLPGVTDPERVKALIGRTAKMAFHLVDDRTNINDARRGKLPAGSMLVSGGAGSSASAYVVEKRPAVGGEHLIDARASFQDGAPVVSFTFDAAGATKFAKTTRENINKLLAIVLDGEVISAPVIQGAIPGGKGIISGNFTVETAADLAMLLRSGALPAPLQVLEERTVGPSLGIDSIKQGSVACLVGLALVVVSILFVYGFFGIITNIALILNLSLMLGALSFLGATLTLPGIAGIVLTMGMAVDSNVLIFERMREEARHGRTPINAAESGFANVMSTIVDANITTLIAAFVLFQFGTGPVKGFAVTLALGIITTMFTAIMVTRMMVSLWLMKKKPKQLPL
ncbi:MAG: protein translocase subunit SecD [Alphaproteobacteria bacterium]